MSIKGLTETRRLTRLGKIRLGVKATAQSGKEYPKAVDYFVCPPEVQAIYGEKPKELDIVFPIQTDPAEWQWYRAYSASRGLICKGDGEVAMALIDIATGEFAKRDSPTTEMREVVCNPKDCPVHQKGQCHRMMTLQFIVRGVQALGVYQLNTGSVNSIINVNSTLSLVTGLVGRYSMVPMKLCVVPQEVTPEGKKKTVYVLQLIVQKSVDDLLALPTLPVSHALLPAADTEPPDDLYPEGIIAEDPTETPPQVSERPAPARKMPTPRAKKAAAATEPPVVVEPAIPEPEPPAVEEKPKVNARRREPGSLTTEQKTIIGQLMGVDSSKFTILKLLKKYGEKDPSWSVKNSGELSEYQAAIILHVIDGGAAEDIA